MLKNFCYAGTKQKKIDRQHLLYYNKGTELFFVQMYRKQASDTSDIQEKNYYKFSDAALSCFIPAFYFPYIHGKKMQGAYK